jgi:hypothetical protein
VSVGWEVWARMEEGVMVMAALMTQDYQGGWKWTGLSSKWTGTWRNLYSLISNLYSPYNLPAAGFYNGAHGL